MSLWLVRAGKHGEQEQAALENNLVTIDWDEFPDLSRIKSKEELSELHYKLNPTHSKNTAANFVGQLWRFFREIKKDDLVALPLKSQSAIAIGKVEGDYEYKELAPHIKHIRRVKWLKTVPRSAFDQDILASFGALMTVCKIEKNDAENRVKKLLQKEGSGERDAISPPQEEIDIEGYSRDQIVKYIGAKFKGHSLPRLMEAILRSQGYITRQSPPGPDGGVDMLAASGPLGFDKPRICVQVKSSSTLTDVKVLRELQGVMSKVRAEQGLLAAWGGFTSQALQEARDAFFSIRLWDQGAILEEIFKYYNRFDDELKAELPLKKVWALVIEE